MVRIWLAVACALILLSTKAPISHADSDCKCGTRKNALAGTWTSMIGDDGYVVSIGSGADTGEGAEGTFTKKSGRWKLFGDAKKFRNIKYVSDNRWEGEHLNAFRKNGRVGTKWFKATFSLKGPDKIRVKADNASYSLTRVGDAPGDVCLPCEEKALPVLNINITRNMTCSDESTMGRLDAVVYGGGPALVGHPEGASGVSPFSCAPILGTAFVFGDEFPQEPSALCLQMEFTIAKMFGIENHVQCGDISSWDLLGECAGVDAVVADVELQCGEFEPSSCQCNSSSTSNSFEIIAGHAGLCP